ncbi:MAG: type IV pilus biogenesis/stability protein PilW [Methylococcales bacterium]
MNYKCSLLILCLGIAACDWASKRETAANISRESLADTYTELGKEYLQLGRDEVALENFNKALKTDPENSEAHRAIAILYQKLGDQNLLEYHLKQAITFGSSNASAKNDYGNLLCSRGNYVEAESHFKQAIDTPLYHRRWVAMTNAGICALRAGRLQESENYLREALKLQPTFSPALLEMAKFSVKTNNSLSGRAFIQRYMSSSPTPRPEALLLGVEIEQKLGDQAAARKYRSKLEDSYPESKEAQSLSGLP